MATICSSIDAAAIAEKYNIPETEVIRLWDLIESARERFGNNQAKLKRYIQKLIENREANVAAMKRDAVIDLAKRRSLYEGIKTRAAAGDISFGDALLELFEGSQRQHAEARVSIDSTRKAIAGEAFSRLFRKLREKDGLMKMLRKSTGDFETAVRMELEGGAGSSKKKYPQHYEAASKVADALRTTTDYLFKRANDAGVTIRYLKNYTPHTHDIQRILKVADTPENRAKGLSKTEIHELSKLEWKKDMRRWLELDENKEFPPGTKSGREKSFGTVGDEEFDEILDAMFYNITEGRAINVEGAGGMEMRVAMRHAKHRVIHFNNSLASNAYQKRYGKKGGSLLASYIDYIYGMSRDIAATEMLGVNSKKNLKAVMNRYHSEMRANPNYTPEQRAAMNPENIDAGGLFNPLGQAFEIAHGFADVPGNIKRARISRGLRAIANMAKLGRAALASIVDVATTGVNLSYQGVHPFRAYTGMFEEIMQRVSGNKAQREILDAIGVGFDSILGEIAHRYSAGEIGIGGKLGSWEATFFKLSGLEGWTDMLRSAGARMSANHVGNFGGKRWSELGKTKAGKRLQRVLKLYGIDKDVWHKISKGAQKEADGRMYILPENVTDDAAREALMRMYQEESTYFVTMPDAKTRRLMTQGTRPGTIPGEAIRFMGQFKSFPVGITQKLFGRAYYAGGGAEGFRGFLNPKVGDGHVAHLIAAMMGMGYLAMTAKDLSSGKKPRDVTNLNTWLATILHSGAGGIYADFLFASLNNRGNKFWDTVVGPVPGTAKDLLIDNLFRGMFVNIPRGEWDKLGARLLGEFGEQAPYANHFATKYALDYMIFNYLLETSNPGSLKRREKFMEEHYGQEYFIPPSDQFPSGVGELIE
jgi:hypothetical protein